MSENNSSTTSIIWDLPTRVFHWLFVSFYALAWLSYDDNRYLFVHVYAGYLFLGLLLFRLVWGIIGTRHAQFRAFAYNYQSVTGYLKDLLTGSAMRHIGHNPAGGWAIFAMLTLGLLVSISGLLTLGGEEQHGPLKGFIPFSVGYYARDTHAILAWTILAFTAVHVVGVLIESYIHKDNLIWSMLTGHKTHQSGVASVRGHHLLGLLIVVVIAASPFIYFRGYLVETADHLFQPYKGPVLPDNATWRSECGDCHFAFHPSLLPKRSWVKIFAEQHDHFGDDLDLDADTIKQLTRFHVNNAAENGVTEPARKINFSIPDSETPIQITKTAYWVHKHSDISDKYWKSEKVITKSNCAACHLDAEQGTYEDSDMRLPKLKLKPKAL